MAEQEKLVKKSKIGSAAGFAAAFKVLTVAIDAWSAFTSDDSQKDPDTQQVAITCQVKVLWI